MRISSILRRANTIRSRRCPSEIDALKVGRGPGATISTRVVVSARSDRTAGAWLEVQSSELSRLLLAILVMASNRAVNYPIRTVEVDILYVDHWSIWLDVITTIKVSGSPESWRRLLMEETRL
jgi:hypothetical protein